MASGEALGTYLVLTVWLLIFGLLGLKIANAITPYSKLREEILKVIDANMKMLKSIPNDFGITRERMHRFSPAIEWYGEGVYTTCLPIVVQEQLGALDARHTKEPHFSLITQKGRLVEIGFSQSPSTLVVIKVSQLSRFQRLQFYPVVGALKKFHKLRSKKLRAFKKYVTESERREALRKMYLSIEGVE